MSKSIKIVIVDDHEVVLDGLKAIFNPALMPPILAGQESFSLVGIAKNGEHLLEQLGSIRHADVVLMDYALTGMNGLETAVLLKKELPHLRVIIFSMHESDALIKEVFACNLEGYVSKSEGRNRMLEVIRRVFKGERVFPVLKNAATVAMQQQAHVASDLPLSKREREIVCEIVQGLTTDEIARKLNIAFNTVEVHRNNIYRKLNINKSTELIRIAMAHQLCKEI